MALVSINAEEQELKVYNAVIFDLKFKLANYYYTREKYETHVNKQIDIISDIMLYSCEHIDIIARNNKTVEQTDNFLAALAGRTECLSDILNNLSIYQIDMSLPQNVKTVNNARHSINISKNTIKRYLVSKTQFIADKLNDDVLNIIASYLIKT